MSRPGDGFFKEPVDEKPKEGEIDDYARSQFIRALAVAFVRSGTPADLLAESVLNVLNDLDATVE